MAWNLYDTQAGIDVRAVGGATPLTQEQNAPQLMQSTTIATLTSQTVFTLTAGSADNDVFNGCVVRVTDSAAATQKAFRIVSDYVGSSKQITLVSDPDIFTMAVGDTIDIVAPSSVNIINIEGEDASDAIAAALLNALIASYQTSGSVGEAILGGAQHNRQYFP